MGKKKRTKKAGPRKRRKGLYPVDKEEYTPESVISKWGHKVLVKWKGYPDAKDDTWETLLGRKRTHVFYLLAEEFERKRFADTQDAAKTLLGLSDGISPWLILAQWRFLQLASGKPHEGTFWTPELARG